MKIEQVTDDSWDINAIKFDRSHRGVCWINASLQTAYLGIPKCASSTLRKDLKLDKDIVDYDDVPDSWFTFTIIREPITRFVSAYIEATYDCAHHPGGRFNHDLELSPDKIQFLKELMQAHDDCGRMAIYLDKIEEDWGFLEPHCVPQMIYLSDRNGVPYKDVELFGLDDLSMLEYHMDTKFQRHNRSENVNLKRKLIKFIHDCPSVKRQVQRLYDLDFQLWENYLELKATEPVSVEG